MMVHSRGTTPADGLSGKGHDRYRRTLDSLLEGFQIIGFDWTYLYVNPTAARHGKRTVDELIGHRVTDAYPGIDQTPLFDLLQQCMAERTSHTLENSFTYPDGRTAWFEIRIEAVPEGICVYSLDISDRKRAAAERQKLEAEIQVQRLRVFRATMSTVHDIVNNLLNNLQLVRLEAEGKLSTEMVTLFDQMIADGARELRILGDLQAIEERQTCVGPAISYRSTATSPTASSRA